MKQTNAMQYSLIIGLLSFSFGILISFLIFGYFANLEFKQSNQRNQQLITAESRFIETQVQHKLHHLQKHLFLLRDLATSHQKFSEQLSADSMQRPTPLTSLLSQQLQTFHVKQLQEFAIAHPQFVEINILNAQMQNQVSIFADQVKIHPQDSVQLERKFQPQIEQLQNNQLFISPVQFGDMPNMPGNHAYIIMVSPYSAGPNQTIGYVWAKISLQPILAEFSQSQQAIKQIGIPLPEQPTLMWLLDSSYRALSENPLSALWQPMQGNTPIESQLTLMLSNAEQNGVQTSQINTHRYWVQAIQLDQRLTKKQNPQTVTVNQLTPLFLVARTQTASSLTNYILSNNSLRPVIYSILAANFLLTIFIGLLAYRHACNRFEHEKNNNLLLRFIQKSPQAIMIASPNGEILLSNQGAASLMPRLMNYFAKPNDDEVPTYVNAENFNFLQQLSSEEQYKLFQMETIFMRLHLPETRREPSKYFIGRIFAIEHDNELLAIGAIYTDQTQIEEAEHELRSAEERISAIFDSAADAILLVDQKGRIIEHNITAEHMFGYSDDEFKELTVEQLMPEDFRKAHVNLRSNYMQHPHMRLMSDAARLTAQNKQGDIFPIEASLNAIDGEDKLVVCTVRDIRERQRIQQQLSQAQKMDAIGKLTGGIAHDFNNLLSILIGNLDLAEMNLEQQKSDKALKSIHTAQEVTERATNLTKRLLSFARKQTLTPELIDLRSLLEKEQDMIQRVINKDIKLHLEIAEQLPLIKADPMELQTALINLAVNANDAMPEGGDIFIKAEECLVEDSQSFLGEGLQDGRYALLSITDTGTGIPKDRQEKIFEPFFTTKPVGKGTGLGLSMVYGFMKQSGGQVKIYSELGIGTSFKLYLPAIDDAQQVQSESPEMIQSIADNEDVFRGENQNYQILIVDDEYELMHLAEEYLQSAGYRVISTNSSQNALHEIENHGDKIDLVFSDVIMPEQNGLQMAQQIHKLYPNIPVIFASGFPEEALQHNYKTEQPINILKKPYRKMALLEFIDEHLPNKS
ncbi:PAS domain S-box protein [Thiomicrorhabdus sp. 6S2-11]|uniref:histidine kinase n=1 Tax=Thiomicrorhabdus marina TaxID=2818442 RepID=A0ABS3Q3B8_9GAMM|nr:PAS domain-containing hybrid sensor histidine kinase/response regulator [Thiomicrorhabdus marina]MBO1926781.1 PAS domain S-box protein [Thiomicrorhabdus marina]